MREKGEREREGELATVDGDNFHLEKVIEGLTPSVF